MDARVYSSNNISVRNGHYYGYDYDVRTTGEGVQKYLVNNNKYRDANQISEYD